MSEPTLADAWDAGYDACFNALTLVMVTAVATKRLPKAEEVSKPANPYRARTRTIP